MRETFWKELSSCLIQKIIQPSSLEVTIVETIPTAVVTCAVIGCGKVPHCSNKREVLVDRSWLE